MYLSYFFLYLSLAILWSNLANQFIRLPSSTTQPQFSFTILAILPTSSTGHFSFRSLIMLAMKEVMFEPARGMCLMQLLITKPSTTGMIWVTPSPESRTVPVQLMFSEIPDEDMRANTAWTPMQRPLTLKVSNIISATFSLFSGGLRGGSVKTTTVSSGSHLRQSKMLRCQNFSIRSQFLTIPPSIGFTTLWLLYRFRASSPIQKSKVSHIFLLLPTNCPPGFWFPVSAIRVGISKAGSVLPAQPILVQPVPLSITTILLSKFIDIYQIIKTCKQFMVNHQSRAHILILPPSISMKKLQLLEYFKGNRKLKISFKMVTQCPLCSFVQSAQTCRGPRPLHRLREWD